MFVGGPKLVVSSSCATWMHWEEGGCTGRKESLNVRGVQRTVVVSIGSSISTGWGCDPSLNIVSGISAVAACRAMKMIRGRRRRMKPSNPLPKNPETQGQKPRDHTLHQATRLAKGHATRPWRRHAAGGSPSVRPHHGEGERCMYTVATGYNDISYDK